MSEAALKVSKQEKMEYEKVLKDLRTIFKRPLERGIHQCNCSVYLRGKCVSASHCALHYEFDERGYREKTCNAILERVEEWGWGPRFQY
jgi:hypothetical protein